MSRRHAILYPTSDCVKLEDEKSLYGTYFGAQNYKAQARVPTDEHTFLGDSDLIYFGRFGSAWRLKRVQLSVVTTKLDSLETIGLKSYLKVLNGNWFLSEWSNSVTHLVTTKITFTQKLLMALVNCVSIVTADFFKDTIEDVRKTGEMPAVDSYIPPPSDDLPDTFDYTVNEKRKTLFKGLALIFLGEHSMEQYQGIVKCAGGTCSMWDKKKSSIIRVASRVIVDNKSLDSSRELSEYLTTKGRRLIPDSEIGLAIAAGTTIKYCNPKHQPELGLILALETPLLQNSSDVLPIVEVPETLNIDSVLQHEKTVLRVATPAAGPSTEIPESVASNFAEGSDDDSFEQRSQMIIDLVDKHSQPSSNVSQKRKLSDSPKAADRNEVMENSDRNGEPSTKKSQRLPEMQTDSSQFITRTRRKERSPEIEPIMEAPKNKRTLADLLAKDDDEEDLFAFSTCKRSRSNALRPAPVHSKVVRSQVNERPVPKSTASDRIDSSEGASKEAFKVSPIVVSLTSGWLSKSLQKSCHIKAEPTDEPRDSWIESLMNTIQVREVKVNLSLTTSQNNFTSSNIIGTADNLSRRNFKSFKKQSVLKTSTGDDFIKTKPVLITEKL